MYYSHDLGIERMVFPDARAGDYATSTSEFMRLGIYYTTEERTFDVGDPPVPTLYTFYYPNQVLFDNPVTAIALSPSDPNVLYFGSDDGDFGRIDSIRSFGTPIVESVVTKWLYATGIATADDNLPILSGQLPLPTPIQTNLGVMTDIAIDPNSPWTLLAASSQGLRRSLNKGGTMSVLASSNNTRATLIDPTNVIYFFYGAEDGLYRSKNAGSTWTRINTGLGGQQTINAFTQSLGPPGSKRRIWVGTTGGVFMDGRSLDLQ